MSGFFGLGQSGGERQGIGALQNLIGFGQAGAERSEAAGQRALAGPQAYWQGLLAPGRTQAISNAAPVTNAVQQQTDALRAQEAQMGTGRGGGTAGANREASSTEMKAIDDIINQNLMGQRGQAAQGLAGVGGLELGHAGQLAGITGQAGASELGNAVAKEAAQGNDFSNLFRTLL